MSKTFWAVIAIIVIIFGGIVLFKGNKDDSGINTAATKPTNHLIGNTSSKVKLVEYGDYQCPYCGQFYPIVKQVQQKYNDQIAFQFRNLPLNQRHKNAFAAARAAEAAGIQGKYWEMHDALYQNQQTWGEADGAQSIFEQYAQQLGLNVTKFKSDSASNAVNGTINADIQAFLKTGNVESTPTFLLDDKKITPGYSVDQFSKYIDAELKAKGQQ